MDFLGEDILVDDDGDMVINPRSGDFSTASGIDCVAQDILEEFRFPYLDDPDNPERGNRMMQFVNCDSDDVLVTIEMTQEAKRVVYRDPRIKKGSVKVTAQPGAEGYALITFETITGKIKENLVVPISSEVAL